ncbi:MAG: Hercynine oxygenase [Myxococcota bacterium]|nr:Hercynine oxygenase [Myxococcota bacterium]
MAIECPKCGFSNPDIARFCGQCATPLAQARPAPPANPWGAVLGEVPLTQAPASRAPPPIEMEPLAAQSQPGEVLADRYQLHGAGAHRELGLEFPAADLQFNRECMVLLVANENLPAAESRKRLAALLQEPMRIPAHPNISQITDAGIIVWQGQEYVYVVSQKPEGASLRTLLDAARAAGQKGLEPRDIGHIMKNVAEGLEYLQNNRLICGALYLDMLYDGGGHGGARGVQIRHPGLPVMIQQAGGISIAEWASSHKISLAPEIAAGERPRPQSDVYGLGSILYELCVGVPPGRGADWPIHTLRPGFPEALQYAYDKATSTLPSERFPSPMAFLKMLADAAPVFQVAPALELKGAPPQAPAAPLPSRVSFAARGAPLPALDSSDFEEDSAPPSTIASSRPSLPGGAVFSPPSARRPAARQGSPNSAIAAVLGLLVLGGAGVFVALNWQSIAGSAISGDGAAQNQNDPAKARLQDDQADAMLAAELMNEARLAIGRNDIPTARVKAEGALNLKKDLPGLKEMMAEIEEYERRMKEAEVEEQNAALARTDAILRESKFEWVKAWGGVHLNRSEVTVIQYRACVDVGRCTPAGNSGNCNWDVEWKANHPINCVDWNQAQAFCEFVGGRLPTDNEWYTEASLGNGRRFPWGNEPPNCNRAIFGEDAQHYGCRRDATWPVCSKPEGASFSGLCDMAGNVAEWTADMVREKAVVRGGSWGDLSPVQLEAKAHNLHSPLEKSPLIGFRCARGKGAAPKKGKPEK